MKVDLTAKDLDTIMESLRYFKRRIAGAPDMPQKARDIMTDKIEGLLQKMSEVKRD